jgi:hypothetical protein
VRREVGAVNTTRANTISFVSGNVPGCVGKPTPFGTTIRLQRGSGGRGRTRIAEPPEDDDVLRGCRMHNWVASPAF